MKRMCRGRKENVMCDVKYEDLPVIYDGQCQEITPEAWEIIMQMAEGCDSDE